MSSLFPEQAGPANDFGKNARKQRKSAKGRPAETTNKLDLLQLEDRLVPAGQITGQVFLDFNSNGLLDTTSSFPNDGGGTYTAQADQGVGGVIVTAYDSANVVRGVATSVGDGTYTLAATGTGGYRLEFTNIPSGDLYGPQGANASPPPQGSSTSVQFVPDGNSSNRNLSLSVPAGYTNNPNVITNLYLIGDQTGTLTRGPLLGTNDYSTEATIISFPYSAGTTSQADQTAAQIPSTHSLAVESRFVGATWGLAQNTNTNTILASAFTKKHVGYGPGGPGAIYTMNTTGTTASLWVDLSVFDPSIGGQLAINRAAYTNNDQYFLDSGNVGWDAVGKTSLGGLAISDDNTKVFVMNLNDRKLYIIPVNADGSANVAGITSILIPVPNNATGNTSGTNRGDLRPFAVEYRDGLVYVGMVNSAESTPGARSNLRGYVYTYNPTTNAWSARSVINESAIVDGFRLDYAKATSFGGPDAFNAWVPTFNNVNTQFNPLTNNAVKYPQAMISGLAFDANGNLNIAIRDRAGDQLGNQVASDPSAPAQLDLGISAGDLLKAGTNNNGTWTLESNGTVGGNTTGGANNNEGPGGGEFFYQDDYQNGTHTEVQSGAVASVPGFPDVISTVFDPLRFSITKTAGIRWYNSSNGAVSKAYQLYDGTTSPGTFGKATGLGDLLVVQPPGGREIGNRVWNDANGNGRQDPGENPISNVQVVLFLNNAAFATATTDANGEYYFSSNAGTTTANKIFGLNLAQAGTYTLGIPVAQGPLAGLVVTTSNVNGNAEDLRDNDFVLNANTNRAEFTVPTVVRGESNHTFDAGFRSPNNGQLSGFVYADRNNNGLFETGQGEPSIAGVLVVLTGTDGVGNPITPQTATTDNAGFYQFTNLFPGTYTVTETQPAAFLDGKDTPGTIAGVSTGSNAVNDVLSGIVLPVNGNSINNNFGELEPAALNGFVYLDSNNDGTFQNTETPIQNVVVVLTGTNDLGAITPQTLSTSVTGFYSFTNLRPGSYKVSETQPVAFADGIDTPGNPGSGTTLVNDVIDAITLTPNLVSPNNNFGERPLAASSISGYVYFDPNDDGLRAGPPGEPGIPGTTVVLTGVTTLGVTITPQTTTTDSLGFYQFTGLQAGIYRVQETQPANYLDGKDTAGNFSGTVTNDSIANVTLTNSAAGVNYNFGELLPLSIGDFVFDDANNNGLFDAGETGLANVVVELVNTGNATVVTATTNAQGGYLFTNLLQGNYQVQIRKASLPTGYVSSTGQTGSLTNGPFENPAPGALDNRDGGVNFDATFVRGNAINLQYGLMPTGETATPGGIADPAAVFSDANSDRTQDFGFFRPLTIGNLVYIDANNDGQFNAGDTPQDGVVVRLTRRATFGNTLQTLTATTAGGGQYLFTNLGRGDYAVELDAPAGFTSATGVNGTNVEPATQNNVDGQDKGTNQGGQLIRAGDIFAATDNLVQDFGLVARASISGFVYHDLSNDGLRAGPPNEPGIPGTTVVLTGTVAGIPIIPVTQTTDANGFYSFTNLADGIYTVTETQPNGYLDGKDTLGNFNGTLGNDVLSNVTLVAGNAGVNYNFGEILPAALNGFVYVDPNNNGIKEVGETPLSGIRVTLTGTNDLGNTISLTQSTSGLGFYSFTNLRPGTYSVAETQPPAPYVDGKDTPGVPGGGNATTNDVIAGITLTSGLTSPDNNFGELLFGQLSGYVYRDPNVNGQYETTLAERGIPGTKVVLFAEGPNGLTAVATASTASDGFYSFRNLTPGNYRVVESQPLGFYDGLDTVGTTGGSNAVNDVLASIPVVGGGNSVNNNFGEIQNVNLFGYVWIDTNRNGIFDPGEAGIPNAVVAINGTAFSGTPIANTLNASQSPSGLSVVTDANGFYIFTRLPPGSYNLVQTNTPAGLSDFASQNAAPGLPIQLSTNTTFGGIGLQNPAPGPLNFGKVFENPTVTTDDPPSKESFLGSSLLGAVAPTGNPLVGAPTVAVQTNPQFQVTNATSVKPVYLAAGAGAGFSPVVRVFDYRSGSEIFRFTAFDANFLGGVDVATGDINGDGTPDIIVAAGPGAGPHVKVFDGLTGAEIRSFFAYDSAFRGGVMVASGDVDGDGFDDIITGAMTMAAPHVKAFSGRTGAEIASFIAFDGNTTTGVRVAAGDIDGDGKADIIASTAAGTTARVRAFSGANRAIIADIAPFDDFQGGIFVTAGDFDGNGKSDIIISAGAGGGPRVSVYNQSGNQLASFFAGDASITTGIRVAAKDLNGDGRSDIITGAGIGSASRVTGFSGAGLGIIEDFYLFDSGVRTGIYVG